jgi:trans-aconitate 2-methyltransferase
MMGTTLRPMLQRVDRGLRERFLADLRERLLLAYPPEADGSTLFPFRRLFLVARRPH